MEEIPKAPQVDYRGKPSYGSAGSGDEPAGRSPNPAGRQDQGPDPTSGHLDGYDQPTEPGAYSAAPPTDQTWKGYDEKDDATRFNGINNPLEQAQLHAEPDPAIGSLGYSPDLDATLAWERKVSGAPPP